jgi:hypothetical protein
MRYSDVRIDDKTRLPMICHSSLPPVALCRISLDVVDNVAQGKVRSLPIAPALDCKRFYAMFGFVVGGTQNTTISPQISVEEHRHDP